MFLIDMFGAHNNIASKYSFVFQMRKELQKIHFFAAKLALKYAEHANLWGIVAMEYQRKCAHFAAAARLDGYLVFVVVEGEEEDGEGGARCTNTNNDAYV